MLFCRRTFLDLRRTFLDLCRTFLNLRRTSLDLRRTFLDLRRTFIDLRRTSLDPLDPRDTHGFDGVPGFELCEQADDQQVDGKHDERALHADDEVDEREVEVAVVDLLPGVVPRDAQEHEVHQHRGHQQVERARQPLLARERAGRRLGEDADPQVAAAEVLARRLRELVVVAGGERVPLHGWDLRRDRLVALTQAEPVVEQAVPRLVGLQVHHHNLLQEPDGSNTKKKSQIQHILVTEKKISLND